MRVITAENQQNNFLLLCVQEHGKLCPDSKKTDGQKKSTN